MNSTTDEIDAVADALWPGVVAQQNAFLASEGEFCQMLWTHSQPPSSPAPPDNLAARPTDQPASPLQSPPSLMRGRMKIDTYGKPDGWVMTLEAAVEGVIWRRVVDCGTNASRNEAWHAVALPP
jgi:hypothetical protein